ncbi:molybdopterin molybdotransferase MoeA [Micrococcales bacterium 31B]|nr:molybdopterin molybdotransferase MoeA [Micrococcales bacterium 31B]
MNSPVSVAEHRDAVCALLAPALGARGQRLSLPLADAVGHVLAESLANPLDSPPFDNSQMDGYAVNLADARAAASLRVGATIAAGAEPGRLPPGTAAPIMTGAPIPEGANAVVPIERCTPDRFDDTLDRVAFDAAWLHDAHDGIFVRPRGSDLQAGKTLVPGSTRLGAAQIGVIAGAGFTHVTVRRPLRVGIISSGDELVAPGNPLASGKIYDANTHMLSAAVRETGAEVAFTLHVPDGVGDFWSLWRSGAAPCDLLITSAGVSQGAFEVIKSVFADCTFYSVGMQPGGPQGLGRLRPDAAGAEWAFAAPIPVLNFPGNPVSALISFEMFLRPLLCEAQGLSPMRVSTLLPIAQAVESPPKHQVRRARVLRAGGRPISVALMGGPSSHLLHSYSVSDALVHLPPEVTHVRAGDPVETWFLERVFA